MYSDSRVRGLWSPGVSMKTNWVSPLVSTPVMRVRVVWGLSETIATFSPIRALSRLDFPTLGRPTMATNADLVLYSGSVKMLLLPAPVGRVQFFRPLRRGAKMRRRSTPASVSPRRTRTQTRPRGQDRSRAAPSAASARAARARARAAPPGARARRTRPRRSRAP